MISAELERLLLAELGPSLQVPGEYEINLDDPSAQGLVFAWTAENPRRNAMSQRRWQNATIPIAGDPVWFTGPVPGGGRAGAAAIFDGSGNARATHSVSFEGANQLTILALAETADTASYGAVFEDTTNGGSPYISYDLQFRVGGVIRWELQSGGALTTLDFPVAVANTPYFMGGTYDGATSRQYIDGKMVQSAAMTGALGSGGHYSIGDDVFGSALNGKIYLIYAWRRALPEAEIRELARNPRRLFQPSALTLLTGRILSSGLGSSISLDKTIDPFSLDANIKALEGLSLTKTLSNFSLSANLAGQISISLSKTIPDFSLASAMESIDNISFDRSIDPFSLSAHLQNVSVPPSPKSNYVVSLRRRRR